MLIMDELYVFFLLLECTCEDEKKQLVLGDLLTFITGADKIPPMEFKDPIRILFLYEAKEVLPTTSTCVLCIHLPTIHCDYYQI